MELRWGRAPAVAAVPIVARALAWLVALSAWCVAGVQVPDLQVFFCSPQGLNMSDVDGKSLAMREVGNLTSCGITVAMLQALKDTMYPPNMGMFLEDVRRHILPLAYQHASPGDLSQLYQTLVHPMGLPAQQAQTLAMDMASSHAEPGLLSPLYAVLMDPHGPNLPAGDAQALAPELCAAGAEPNTLSSSYAAAIRAHGSPQAALEKAEADAVCADLNALQKRYGEDGWLHRPEDLQAQAGGEWLQKWLAAPKEKRVGKDGKEYRAAEFRARFGDDWVGKWAAAADARQRRIAPNDGKTCTIDDFRARFGSWQDLWAKAYEVLDLCAGLGQSDCSKQWALCQWQWTGDWTTSCVVRPLSYGEVQKDVVAVPEKGPEEVLI